MLLEAVCDFNQSIKSCFLCSWVEIALSAMRNDPVIIKKIPLIYMNLRKILFVLIRFAHNNLWIHLKGAGGALLRTSAFA